MQCIRADQRYSHWRAKTVFPAYRIQMKGGGQQTETARNLRLLIFCKEADMKKSPFCLMITLVAALVLGVLMPSPTIASDTISFYNSYDVSQNDMGGFAPPGFLYRIACYGRYSSSRIEFRHRITAISLPNLGSDHPLIEHIYSPDIFVAYLFFLDRETGSWRFARQWHSVSIDPPGGSSLVVTTATNTTNLQPSTTYKLCVNYATRAVYDRGYGSTLWQCFWSAPNSYHEDDGRYWFQFITPPARRDQPVKPGDVSPLPKS